MTLADAATNKWIDTQRFNHLIICFVLINILIGIRHGGVNWHAFIIHGHKLVTVHEGDSNTRNFLITHWLRCTRVIVCPSQLINKSSHCTAHHPLSPHAPHPSLALTGIITTIIAARSPIPSFRPFPSLPPTPSLPPALHFCNTISTTIAALCHFLLPSFPSPPSLSLCPSLHFCDTVTTTIATPPHTPSLSPSAPPAGGAEARLHPAGGAANQDHEEGQPTHLQEAGRQEGNTPPLFPAGGWKAGCGARRGGTHHKRPPR